IIYDVIIDVNLCNTAPGDYIPCLRGRLPPAKLGFLHTHTRSERSPAIVIAGCAPGNPCRRPVFTRNPHPSIIIVIKPSAVVESRPAPIVVLGRGPAVIAVDPVTFSGIWPEIAAYIIGNPNITVIRVINPGAIWAQLIVKNLVGLRRIIILRIV